MEQIRIIKEMREADAGRGRTGKFIRPRFMVWENVPGAFSSNKGDDFRAVLEETIRIAEPDAPDVPLPAKGKWPLADCWYGDGWSVAYRVLDAQFWGVPQRRRRIALVADFGGHAAPEILFVRQGVCGDTAESGAAREETAAGAGGGAGEAIPINTMLATRHKQLGRGTGFGIGMPGEPEFTISTNHCHAVFQPSVICLNDQGGSVMGTSIDVAGTLRAQEHGHRPVVCAGFQHKAGSKAHGIGYEEEKAPTLTSEQQCAVNIFGKQVIPTLVSSAFKGPGNTQDGFCVYDARGNGDGKTVCTPTGDHQDRVTDYTAIVMGVDCRNGTESPDVVATLQAHNSGGFSLNSTHPVRIGGQVRRLTPLECERLQGFPDGWTDIGPWEKVNKKGKVITVPCADSLRYKALGNSIALPPWSWVLKRLCACYERDATMASLFDGIGGFPLIWERLNGPGTCLWASEIEQFPIAVTRRRFDGKSRW